MFAAGALMTFGEQRKNGSIYSDVYSNIHMADYSLELAKYSNCGKTCRHCANKHFSCHHDN